MSSGLSRSSSIDSRYDTDSSPQRPLNESYIANLHTKLKKVSQNNNSLEKVGAKIKYQRDGEPLLSLSYLNLYIQSLNNSPCQHLTV